MGPGVDELYVLARRALLDALEALHEHREAIVLVGAQAVYRRTSIGVEMAIRATSGFVDADELAVSCELLANELLGSL